MTKLSIILIFTLLLISCKQESSYTYLSDLENYLYTELGIETSKLKENEYIFILPLQSCDPCISKNFELIKNSTNDIHIVLVGKPKPWQIPYIEIFNKRFSVFEDLNEIAFEYETGLGKPLLVSKTSGNIKVTVMYDDVEISL